MLKNAPLSIIPSIPMLNTPLRSVNAPPAAASASGVESRTLEASQLIQKEVSPNIGLCSPRVGRGCRRLRGNGPLDGVVRSSSAPLDEDADREEEDRERLDDE